MTFIQPMKLLSLSDVLHREVKTMAGVYKVTTGLTGLPVARHPHQTLKVLYNKITQQLERMPAEAAYRRHTQQIINERLNHVKTEPDVLKLEQKINCGQAEELIKQAERELNLARNMLKWKPWEPLVAPPPRNQWKWPLA